MKILAIDSSAVSASCAVTEDKRLISSCFVNVGLTHSETLMTLVADTLEGAQTTLKDIDCLAVSHGPGSFTGVRIGVATVKGLAFANRMSCVGVSTLEAIAYGLCGLEGICCAVMDARREQVYNALFRLSDGRVERLCDDRAISIADLGSELSALGNSGAIWLCGDGAALCHGKLRDSVANLRLPPESIRFQNGYGVALAAVEAINNGRLGSAETLNPCYLRLPQAERELAARLNNK